MEVLRIIITVLEVIASFALIVVVLVQSGKEAGLSGAIAGNNDSFMSKNKRGNLDKILASAGIAILDMSEMKELIDQLTAGEIDEEEFLEKSLGVALDAIKSRFHENLN